jgi:hypothetical protein
MKVAAQREEDPDPEQAPGRPAPAQVVGDNREHRQGTQPVQARHVPLATADRLGHAPSTWPPANRTAPRLRCHARTTFGPSAI